jgi:hypothetical protein
VINMSVDEAPQSLSRPSRSRRVVERVVDGELVLYDPVRQRVHSLNPTAGFIWRACTGQHTLDGIVALLATRYPGDLSAIEADVLETLSEFQREGLLRA